MKRLLSVCLLIVCLCLPVIAGHNVIGGFCECGAPGCTCDPGESPRGQLNGVVSDKSNQETPIDLGSETLLALGLLLLALRYKA